MGHSDVGGYNIFSNLTHTSAKGTGSGGESESFPDIFHICLKHICGVPLLVPA